MNKIIFFFFIAFSLCLLKSAYADQPVVAVMPASISWISKNSTDEVTINNGNANKLTITINADKSSNTANTAGVNIKNCGNTTHIDAGSSAVCTTNDASNPVSFSSDSQIYKASGTYVIKQD